MCKVYLTFIDFVLEHFIYEYASYTGRFIQKHGYNKKGVTRRDIRNKSMARSRYQYYIYLYYIWICIIYRLVHSKTQLQWKRGERRNIRNKSMVRRLYQYHIYLYYFSIQIYAFSFMYSRNCNEALRKCLAWLFSAIIFNNCNWFVFGRKSLEMF